MMEAKTLDNLEFPKILGLIAAETGSSPAHEAIMALQPGTDQTAILQSLDQISEAESYYDREGSLPITGIRDIRELFPILQTGSDTLGGDDFLHIRANLEVAEALHKAFAPEMHPGRRTNFPILATMIQSIPAMTDLRRRIIAVISERGEIRDDASPELQRIRRDMAKTRDDTEKQLGELVRSDARIFQDQYFTLRNERYVVPVVASSQSLVEGIVHDQSGSGQTVFVEPLAFLPLNNRLARLRAAEREELLRILRWLTGLVRQQQPDLESAFTTMVQLDAVVAKARFARRYSASRPEVVTNGMLIDLIDARHPLLHPHCVPLSIRVDAGRSVVVITGPNGGGKTVSLKTIGVNVLLLQSGCFILASPNSRLSVFPTILAGIGENQSIERHLSTFTAHLTRLKEILAQSSPQALVLIDEIGVGTAPEEGAALASGVLKELRRQGGFALATSHYELLKQISFTTPGFVNAGMEFDSSALRPTFRFIMGVPGRSNALAIARQFGLPASVLTDLEACRTNQTTQEGQLLKNLEDERTRAEQLRREWEDKHRELDERTRKVTEELERLREFRRKRRDELMERYATTLRHERKQVEEIIHRLKERLTNQQESPDETRKMLGEARAAHEKVRNGIDRLEDRLEDPLILEQIDPDQTPPPLLAAGQRVLRVGTTEEGQVIRVVPGKAAAVVDFDGKRCTVPISLLSLARKKTDKPGKSSGTPTMVTTATTTTDRDVAMAETGGSISAHMPYLPPELDLRGQRVEEALPQVESFLQEAQIQGRGKVFLIHGKGTGALQRAVVEYLRASPYKKIFRPGRYGEGDLGVTVVVFDPAADDDGSGRSPTDHLTAERPPKKASRQGSAKRR